MNEKQHSSSNAGAWVALAVAILGALVFALWQIGAGVLRDLAYLLTGAVALAVILAAASLPIRSWRKRDFVGETHHYHDGTKTVVKETRVLDGRAVAAPEVKLLQLPQPAQGGAFPELLRAAYQSGVLANPRQRPAPMASGQDLEEFDLGADDWGGPIDA